MLVKDLFNPAKWFKQKSLFYDQEIITASTYRGGEEWRFEDVPGQRFTYKGLESSLKYYSECPPVNAIINRKSQAIVSGTPFLMNKDNKEAKGLIADNVNKLIKNPNPYESESAFKSRLYTYLQCYGYAIVYAPKPYGYTNSIDTGSMFNLAPYRVTIKFNGKIFYQTDISGSIESIKYTDEYGKIHDLLIQDVIIIRDFTPSRHSSILPESKLCALHYPIGNIMAAYESRQVLINSRGPMYVVSNAQKDAGGSSATPDEIKETQQTFKGNYGTRRHQSMAMFAPIAVDVKTIGFSTKDLMLLEENKDSTLAICDGLAYPPHLLGVIDPTFNNRAAAEKDLYQNTILPDCRSIDGQIGAYLKLEEYGLRYETDFSKLPVFQPDALAMATAREKLDMALEREYRYDLINRNRWLELNGEDTIGKEGDVYFSEWLAAGGNDPYARNAGGAATLQDGVTPTNATQNGQGQTGSTTAAN